SLASKGEQNVFGVYYRAFKDLGDTLPALIPQVYLHYDPYTLAQLGGVGRLPSLARYSDMVAADRDLRLAGYEVYRFGANELTGQGSAERIEEFFRRLLRKHGVLSGATLAQSRHARGTR